MDILTFQILVIVESDGDGYHGYCPELKGIHVYGDTSEEALAVAKDAIGVYLKMSLAHGDPIPIGILRSYSPKDALKILWERLFRNSKKRKEFLVELAPA